jgi:hypothetical protein
MDFYAQDYQKVIRPRKYCAGTLRSKQQYYTQQILLNSVSLKIISITELMYKFLSFSVGHRYVTHNERHLLECDSTLLGTWV